MLLLLRPAFNLLGRCSVLLVWDSRALVDLSRFWIALDLADTKQLSASTSSELEVAVQKNQLKSIFLQEQLTNELGQ